MNRPRPLTLLHRLSPLAAAVLLCGPSGCGSDRASRPPSAASSGASTAGVASAPGDPALTRLCQAYTESDDRYWGTAQVRRLESDLQSALAGSGTPAAGAIASLRAQLAQHLLRLGEAEKAREELAVVRRLAAQPGFSPEWKQQVWLLSALASLRVGMRQHCGPDTGPRSCTLSLDGKGVYQDPTRVREAIDLLTAYRAIGQPPPRWAQASRWALNVAHALAGTWPDGVPEDLRLDLRRYASPQPLKPMPDRAHDLGMDSFDLAGGSVIEDLDGDGLLDVVASTMDFCGDLKYYHARGDGTFEEMAAEAGLQGQPGSLNLVQTDYDNDGRIDLFLARGAWLFDGGRHRNSLLHNNGDGTFTDVTQAAGLANPAYPTQVAAWGDYDNDGDLDLYVGNEEAENGNPYPNQLFRNNGDGTFTDVARAAGVEGRHMTKGAAWGDCDNDGDLDLYVSNFGPNQLYINQGDGTFRDVAVERQVNQPIGLSFATWFFDYNNDGWLDLYVAHLNRDVDRVTEDYLGIGSQSYHPRLYRNTGGGEFEDVTREAGLGRVVMPMGAGFGDIDNDGYPDIYLGTGAPGDEAVVPNVLYHNEGGERFTDVTLSTETGHLGKGHGIAFGDLDNDGDQDIYAQIGGMMPGDKSPNALYENPGYGNHWVTLRLVGARTNRPAVGVRLKLSVGQGDGARDIHATVGSGGSFGASSLQQEIGLGGADAIRTLVVEWPASGTRQVFHDLEVDRFYEIHEDGKQPTPLDRPRLTLGGGH